MPARVFFRIMSKKTVQIIVSIKVTFDSTFDVIKAPDAKILASGMNITIT